MMWLRTAVLISLVVVGGCSSRYGVEYESHGKGHPPQRDQRIANLHIPPGHLPPPGSCRVWIPGVPPGRQSPPGDCSRLAAQIPPGAWLLFRPENDPKYVEVSVYDDKHPGVVIDVEIYIAATGELVVADSSR